jgi:hypothetical protein
MDAILTRKCAFCGKDIVITKNNMRMISYKNKSYHTECFKTMCNGRVLKNNRYSPMYSEALQNLKQLETETKKKLMNRFVQDDLNVYLLDQYEVCTLSARFWEYIKDIQKGKYRGKRCLPVDLETLFNMWKDYQKELDKTNAWNRHNGKVIEGESRAIYDLAILMNNYVKYAKKVEKTKREVAEKEKNSRADNSERINYNKIKAVETKDGLGDISDLLDDLI